MGNNEKDAAMERAGETGETFVQRSAVPRRAEDRADQAAVSVEVPPLPEHFASFQWNSGYKTWEQVSAYIAGDDRIKHVYTADQLSERDAMWAQRVQEASCAKAVAGEPVAAVIKRGAERTWMSENLGSLPDGTYSLYLAASAAQPAKTDAPKGLQAQPVAWWDRAVGGFYLSYQSIPEKDIKRGGIVALYTASPVTPAAQESGKRDEHAVACVGCEGKPSVSNSPCAVCGAVAQAGERERALEEAAWKLLAYLDAHDWGGIPEGETANRLRELVWSTPPAPDIPKGVSGEPVKMTTDEAREHLGQAFAVGVASDKNGAHIVIQTKRGDVTYVVYSQFHPTGDTLGTFAAPTQPVSAEKPTAADAGGQSIEGVVKFMRSSDLPNSSKNKCICCPDGDHIFARGVEWDKYETNRPEHFGNGPNVFVSGVTDNNKNEGRRVRLTVEVLPDRAAANGADGQKGGA